MNCAGLGKQTTKSASFKVARALGSCRVLEWMHILPKPSYRHLILHPEALELGESFMTGLKPRAANPSEVQAVETPGDKGAISPEA